MKIEDYCRVFFEPQVHQEDGILTPGRMIHVVFKCISNLSQYIHFVLPIKVGVFVAFEMYRMEIENTFALQYGAQVCSHSKANGLN